MKNKQRGDREVVNISMNLNYQTKPPGAEIASGAIFVLAHIKCQGAPCRSADAMLLSFTIVGMLWYSVKSLLLAKPEVGLMFGSIR